MTRSAWVLAVAMTAASVTGAAARQQTQTTTQPPQTIDQSNQPGHSAPPNVWVQNRGPQEAIPVVFESAEGMATRATAQSWQYTTVTVSLDRDVSGALAPVGADGWEAVGVLSATGDRAVVLFKRPRS